MYTRTSPRPDRGVEECRFCGVAAQLQDSDAGAELHADACRRNSPHARGAVITCRV